MAEIETSLRADLDIAEDVATIVATYPPLQADRHNLRVDVQDGVVHFSGYLMTPISRYYLVELTAEVPGVQGIQDDGLFNDEALRLEIGRVLPPGVLVHVRYGTVVLSGHRPADMTDDQLAAAVSAVPGVKRVVTSF